MLLCRRTRHGAHVARPSVGSAVMQRTHFPSAFAFSRLRCIYARIYSASFFGILYDRTITIVYV